MKKKRWLYAGLAGFVFVIVAIILVRLYPTLELYYTAKRTGQKVTTITDSDGNESKVLTTANSISSTASSDNWAEGSGSNSYSIEEQYGGCMEYTLTDVNFFGSVEEAGVDPSELMRSESVTQLLDQYQFMVADFTITSKGAVPWYEMNNGSMGFLLHVNPSELTVLNNANFIQEEVLCFFSKHPPISDTSTDYYGFTLEDGESIDVQIGCLVPPRAIEDQSVCLILGPPDLGYVYRLFDFSR